MQDVVKDDTVQFKHLLSQMENLNMLSAAKDKNKSAKTEKKEPKTTRTNIFSHIQ